MWIKLFIKNIIKFYLQKKLDVKSLKYLDVFLKYNNGNILKCIICKNNVFEKIQCIKIYIFLVHNNWTFDLKYTKKLIIFK